MSTEKRNQGHEDRRHHYETDFDPGLQGSEEVPAPNARLANAGEYAAFQLGQINRKLDQLIAAVQRLAGSQPDLRPFSERKRERRTEHEG
jgi:hypothetical protein